MAEDSLVGWGWSPGACRAPVPGTQAQFGALMRKETARWARVVKDAGITISP